MPPVLLHRGLEAAADQFPDRAALHAGDAQWSFRHLDEASNSLAVHLRSWGVRPGDRVAIMMANRPEFLVAVQAVSKVGAASVLVSPAWRRREVSHALELTGCGFAIADGGTSLLLVDQLTPSKVLDVDDVTAFGAAMELPRERVDRPGPEATDEAVLVFSSGTTGLPKAVRHTHASMWHATVHWVEALGLGPEDRFQVATPSSHILGLLNLLAAAMVGASIRLHRRFDLDEILRRIEAEEMTLEMAVAPIALAMADHRSIEDYNLSSLRYLMWAATPVTPSVASRVTKRTGVRWLPAYGASEVPLITCNPVQRPDAWRLDSAGLPPNGVTLRVVSLESGELLPPGGVGEIQVRSESAMAGYLPVEETAAAFADGWYRTGDVGWLEPEGWIHLTDRAKEMIKVNAFQVAPAEIEAVLHGHHDVLDCAVFGIPDESAGEVPVAAVQLRPGAATTGADLQLLVATSLATYKQLRDVVMVDEIPRLPSGKVLRRHLLAAYAPPAAERKASD